ncbi:MAG: DNA-directed RNA polymerase subunit omega [Clostridia bacterium]|nr:DNA-directed RNA polymerase subunit omega [Clostridia bacterium]
MMIEPPIDELEKKAGKNKYVLSIIAAKRAKELEAADREHRFATADKKSISVALDEVYNDKIESSEIND